VKSKRRPITKSAAGQPEPLAARHRPSRARARHRSRRGQRRRGSIAWVDPAGALRVGPRERRRGAGPVCYGRGGTRPTVTDANLILGYLDQGSLLGGRMSIDLDAAIKAFDTHIGRPLGLQTTEAAAGVIEIVNHAMAEALRIVSVERGHDPREFG